MRRVSASCTCSSWFDPALVAAFGAVAQQADFWATLGSSGVDQAGALDRAEWDAVKLHATYTETILSRIGAFAELAHMAGAHHERLDGGLPARHRRQRNQPRDPDYHHRDIFDAITAERPYRGAIPIPQALEMMAKTVGGAIDPDCFAALTRALALVPQPAAAA
jgi:response regulator RpfG family c-di-GMP phosphodiesterase